MNIALIPETDYSKPFLRKLILDTLSLELGAGAWPEPMRSHLLEIQYAGRRHAGASPDSESYVLQAEGVSAGWLVVSSQPHELRIVEIMVAPELRGRGIGAAAIRQIQRIAREAGKPLRLNVYAANQGAIRLYERLGFRIVEGNEVQHVMES